MKKFIKMSLVAATAVAGLTSTASAGDLSEMIKDTKLSGYVRYQLVTDHENSTDTDEQAKIVAKVTTPVNDNVTANVKMVAGETSTQNADTKAAMNITEGNFVVNAMGATVIAGLQTSQSPFFANNGDTRSHGVTALVPAGPATIAAAYYTTTTGGGLASPAMTNDVGAIGALVKAGPANINLWYAQVEDGADLDNGGSIASTLNTLNSAFVDASAMSAQVTMAAGPVNVEAMTTQVSNGANDTGVTKLVVSGEAGPISYMAGYAMSNKDGGMVSLDQDSDAISDLGLDNLNMGATKDATAFVAGAKYSMDNGVCASAYYLDGSSDVHADFNELDVKVGYKMSKNFSMSFLYAMGTAPTPSYAADTTTINDNGTPTDTDDVATTTKGALIDANAQTDFAYSQIEFKYTF